jgi:2Fe-2S ferredoxin
MSKVKFISAEGEQDVSFESGYSLMELAKLNDIEGVEAICGGACSCATCHVYVDKEWLAKIPEMDVLEDAMLDTTSCRQDNSRLSCQIRLDDSLDGLIVEVAESY